MGWGSPRPAENAGLAMTVQSEKEIYSFMNEPFALARRFIHTQARLVERLLFAVRFENASPSTVGRVIAACQNADGGLGHALEPDLRCPESQPLFAEVGLSALHDAGWRDQELSLAICAFLEGVSDARGLVPAILPNALESPHAGHWSAAGGPDLNPTAGICGLLHFQGIRHPWLDRATESCCQLLLDSPPKEAHTLLSATHLVEHLPEREMAEQIAERIATTLPKASFFIANAPVREYGMTPLHFARTPTSRWRQLFTDEQIEAHLNDLLNKQQPDGGWPISWEAPGPAATCEWRGRWTLEAISTLVAYGTIQPG